MRPAALKPTFKPENQIEAQRSGCLNFFTIHYYLLLSKNRPSILVKR